VKEKINIKDNKFQVDKIISKHDKIIVTSSNKDHLNQIKSKLNDTMIIELNVREPIDQVPKILIHDVERELSKEEIKDAIMNQNPDIIDENSDIKIEYEFGKGKTKKVVVSTDKATRSKMMNKGRLYCGFIASRISNYISIKQCNNCGGFHHKNSPQRKCNNPRKCLYCSEDHNLDECPVKDDDKKYKCSNCDSHNSKLSENEKKLNMNHKSSDKRNFSIYKSKLKQLESKINNYDN
jgi:hypothetical protein